MTQGTEHTLAALRNARWRNQATRAVVSRECNERHGLLVSAYRGDLSRKARIIGNARATGGIRLSDRVIVGASVDAIEDGQSVGKSRKESFARRTTEVGE